MINNIVIMGRLTADPELRTTQSGISVTSFTVACDRNYDKDKTDFIPCVAWRGTADFITRYFHKGSMIAVQGSLQQRDFEDKNGNKRTIYEINVENASFCGDKKQGSILPDDVEKAETSEISAEFEDIEEGLPF